MLDYQGTFLFWRVGAEAYVRRNAEIDLGQRSLGKFLAA
jgi:hypothetical protein